jgi:hypothetical protein
VQHAVIKGYFGASRHGLTHGGSDGIGCVIVRDVKTEGVVKTDGIGEVEAVDYHGNTAMCSFKGSALGGIGIGGRTHKIDAFITGSTVGICVRFYDIVKFDMDLSGSIMETDLDPNALSGGRGVIDFGGGSTSDMEDMENGTFNLSGIIVNAPNAVKAVVIRTRNTVQNVNGFRNVDLSNAHLTVSDSSTALIQIGDVSGLRNFDTVDCKGMTDNGILGVVTQTNNLIYSEKRGTDTVVLSTTQNIISKVVTFDTVFPALYKPTINITSATGIVQGGNAVIISASNVTASGFTIVATTNDGGNFQTTNTMNINWTAI